MKSPAGVAVVDEYRLIRFQKGRQRLRIALVRNRRNHEHDEVGAGYGFGDIGRNRLERHERVMHALYVDAATPAQSGQSFVVAALQPHIEAAQRQIRSRRQTPMPGPQDRDSLYRHSIPPG